MNKFEFVILDDRLILKSITQGYTGNVNNYICTFDNDDSQSLAWYAVFRSGDKAYSAAIKDGQCIVPQEVLSKEGQVQIGAYATDFSDSVRRISTNWVSVDIEDGAYCDASEPKEPEHDFWEELVLKTVPKIGDDGCWYVYDKAQGKYMSTEQAAQGYTPIRGVDYWTEADKAEIKTELAADIADNLTTDSAEIPLSARQGKVLKEEIDSTVGNINTVLAAVVEGGGE